jgi:hypothetical protein
MNFGTSKNVVRSELSLRRDVRKHVLTSGDMRHSQIHQNLLDIRQVFLPSLARKLGSWVRIPLRAWMFSVCVCVYVFLCLCTGRGLATS